MNNQLLAALSDLPEDVYKNSDGKNTIRLKQKKIVSKKKYNSAHLHNNESEEKVEDLASDDVAVDPDDPLRAGDVLEVVYPDSDRAEGVGQAPERPAPL